MRSAAKKKFNSLFFRIRLSSLSILKTFFFTIMFVYFGYHLFSGSNGIINYFKEKARLENLSEELAIAEERKTSLENKAYKLHSQSLDADLLDEQYRRVTGNIKPNEVIYYLDNK
jgi:cell division protein FtsB